MGSKKKKAAPPGKDSSLNVRTDKQRRERFHAACQVLGTTIEKQVNEFMVEIIRKARIPKSHSISESD